MKTHQPIQACLVAALALGFTGCMTLTNDNEKAREQTEMDRMRENVQRLQEQLAGVQLEQQNLRRDVDELRSKGQDGGTTRTQLSDLERRLQAVEAAREKDRQSIVDQLSRKVADVVGAQQGGRSADATRGAETGYEHVVQQGETLSAIAKAYKVKVDTIIKANNLKTANSIRIGQKLFIPEKD